MGISTKFAGIGSYLTQDLLTRLRVYISQCKEATFSLNEDMMKELQDDFVTMRQSQGGMTVEDFHLLLVLARLVAKSKGRSGLEATDWTQAKTMEQERRSRVAGLAPRPGAQFANGVPMHL